MTTATTVEQPLTLTRSDHDAIVAFARGSNIADIARHQQRKPEELGKRLLTLCGLRRGRAAHIARTARIGTTAAPPRPAPPKRQRPSIAGMPLTDREATILGHVASGKTRNRTAADLGVSLSTVTNALHRAFLKLSAGTLTAAVTAAVRAGALPGGLGPHPAIAIDAGEQRLLDLVAADHDVIAIARHLDTTRDAATKRIRALCDRYGVPDREHLALLAVRHQLATSAGDRT